MVSLEHLSGYAAMAIEQVWEAEWRRNDFFKELVEAYPSKSTIKAIMNSLGRSHQDAYRWASKAAEFPPEMRRADRSPRDHTKEYNARRARAKQVHRQGADVPSGVVPVPVALPGPADGEAAPALQGGHRLDEPADPPRRTTPKAARGIPAGNPRRAPAPRAAARAPRKAKRADRPAPGVDPDARRIRKRNDGAGSHPSDGK